MTPDDFARHVKQNYPLWSRVTGRVTKMLHFGVFVTFEDGIQGIIRRRELSWEGDPRPQELASSGQLIDLIVINVDHSNQRLELSRRLVEHDPWQDFIALAKPGQVVRGRISRIMPYGAFVELRPGVVGLVRVSEIAPWFVERVEDVLWVDDEIQAEILSIDSAKRHIALSIEKRLKYLEQEAIRTTIDEYVSRESGLQMSLGERLGLSARQLERRVQQAPPQSWPREPRLGRILVVDDEHTLADAMERLIYKLGYKVDVVYAGDTGVEQALTHTYDLIFMDLNLPGFDGLEAARRILAGQPASQIILMTGASLADEHSAAIETIDFVDVLLKPFTPEEVEALLERLGRDDKSGKSELWSQSPELAEELGFFQQVSQVVEVRGTLERALTRGLDELRAATKASAGAIFKMDSVGQIVTLEAHSGDVLAFEQGKHRLGASPVKDVILDHQVIWEKDARGRGAARFRYLLPLLNFNSCLGVPIKAYEHVQFGLFLFHQRKHHFTSHHLQRALAASMVIGVAIERHQMEEMMQSFQQLFLVGQLSGGLAHEVNNKLASVEFHTVDLLQGFERLEREHPDLAHTFLYRDLHRTAETIAAMNRSVLETARMFRTLMAGETPRLLNVNDVIHRTLLLIEPLAREYQVEIKQELASELPRTLAVGVRLQQAFHNVILNAIQQIAGSNKEGGRIVVISEYASSDTAYPLKVYIADDGPGIHYQHLEPIFSLGFTTRRQQGTGLGLYITRGLIESMGGRINVVESLMLIGATFLIELPLISEEVTDAQ